MNSLKAIIVLLLMLLSFALGAKAGEQLTQRLDSKGKPCAEVK